MPPIWPAMPMPMNAMAGPVAAYMDPTRAAAMLSRSQGEAMKAAASNTARDELYEFIPSPDAVVDNAARSCLTGYIYSALVDSFCSEQSARMTAMNAADQNAEELLKDLSVQFNRARQAAITQEITEVSAGERAQRSKKEKEGDLR